MCFSLFIDVVFLFLFFFFFFNDTATTEIYTLFPTRRSSDLEVVLRKAEWTPQIHHGCSLERGWRSEEHTSELQSRQYLVCRLLLEKKKEKIHKGLVYQSNTADDVFAIHYPNAPAQHYMNTEP